MGPQPWPRLCHRCAFVNPARPTYCVDRAGILRIHGKHNNTPAFRSDVLQILVSTDAASGSIQEKPKIAIKANVLVILPS